MSRELCPNPNCQHPKACHSVRCTKPGCECRTSFASVQPCAPAIHDDAPVLRCNECGAVSEPGETPLHTHTCTHRQLSLLDRIELLERAVDYFESATEMLRGQAADYQSRLERLERPVDSRDATVWEMGHAAALRGVPLRENPFRKSPR